MTDKVSSAWQQAIEPKRQKVQQKQVDLTQVRDRQAAYITNLRGNNGSTNLQLPKNAQYWSKEKIQPSNDPTSKTFAMPSRFDELSGKQPTNHVFSFTDPKAGQQYRHIQTDSANPSNITVNGKPLGEMTPKFTDGKLSEFTNQGPAPSQFSRPGMGSPQNGASGLPSLLDSLKGGSSNGSGSKSGGVNDGGSSSGGNSSNKPEIQVEKENII